MPDNRTPNWRIESDYDFTETLSPKAWAWQFLKRNKKYQKDYQELEIILKNLRREYGPIETASQRKALHKVPEAYIATPEMMEGETKEAWQIRVLKNNQIPRYNFVSIGLALKWGIKGNMPNPFSQELLEPLFVNHVPWPVLIEEEEEDVCQGIYSGPEIVTLKVNVKLSIDKQLKLAKKKIKSYQDARGIKAQPMRKNGDEWKTHLRFIDAFHEDADATEIDSILAKPKEKDDERDIADIEAFIRDRKSSAFSILEERYKEIPFKDIPFPGA